MTPEVEKYYETYFDLFTTEAWKQFITDIQGNLAQYNIRSVEDEKDLKYKQGQLYIIDHVINWETLIRNAYDELQKETEDASQDI